MDATNLITLGAVAVGGYFLYENFFANGGLPSDAIPFMAGQGTPANVPAGTTETLPIQGVSTAVTGLAYLWLSPSTGMLYTSTTAPTAAQAAAGLAFEQSTAGQAAYVKLFTGSAVSATGSTATNSTSTTTPPATSTTTTTTPPAATPVNYAAMCTATRTAVQQSGDTNFTASGGDYLGSPYHWQYYWNLQSGAPALNINGMFSDTTSPISGAAFCAAVTTYLAAQGLSGYLAGMGFYGMGDDSADDLTGLDTSSLNPVGVGPTLGGGSTVYSTQGTSSNYTPIYIALAAAGAVLLFAGGGRR